MSGSDPVPARATLMVADFRQRRGATGGIEQHLSPDERGQLENLVRHHGGDLLESVSRRLVATFLRADSALDCARVLQANVRQFRNPPWGGLGFCSRVLLAPAPAGVRQPERWVELALKLSTHLQIAPPDGLVVLEPLLRQLKPPLNPQPLRTSQGASTLLFLINEVAASTDTDAETRAAASLSGAGVGLFSELVLKVGERPRIVTPPECPLSVGRSKTCAIQLDGDDVSRVHGRIEFDNEKYFYVDDSRNGSYVLTRDGTEVRLQKERILLVDDGVISPGVPVLKQKGMVIRYRCAPLKLSLGDDSPTKPR